MFRCALLTASIVTLFLSWSGVVMAQSLPTMAVAFTGKSLDNASGTYGTVGLLPRLGQGGHIAFNGFISGAGSPEDFAYFVGLPGDTQIALREDADDGGPELFSSGGNVGVDINGKISVWASLAFPTPIDANQVLYGPMPGGPAITLEGSTVAPGFAGGVFSAIGSGQATNDAGAVAFVGSVRNGDTVLGVNDFGLFAGTAGDLSLVARKGSAAPDASGTTPVFSTFYDKRINNVGQVGFAAALTGTGVNAINDRAIYVWTPGESETGTLALAMQTGNHAPGTPLNTTFSNLDDQPGFNEAGQVSFRGQLTADDIGFTNNFGIWAGAPGDVQLVMRSGSVSPIAGLQFRTPEPGPRINDGGDVAFFSNVSGSGVTTASDRVLWLSTDEGIVPVAREGDAAPGTAAGVTFGTLNPLTALNNEGQLAFTSTLVGAAAGVTTANDVGLWAGSPGALQLIAREGDVIDLDPGPGELLKTISGSNGISFAAGYATTFDGNSADAAFNDAGQIAWRAVFTDATSAIFLTTLPSANTPGDYDNDGDVDGRDFLAWQRGESPDPFSPADLATWQAEYNGGMLTATTAVPEPSSLFLITSVLTVVASRRRRLL